MSLRHFSLLLALGPAYFLSAIASQDRKTAASLALGPSLSSLDSPRPKEEDPAALQSEEIKAKKTDWKKATLFLAGQVLIFAFFFYAARNFPDATNYLQVAMNTWLVGFVANISLRELLGVIPVTLARNSDGKLVGSASTPSPSTPSTYLLAVLSFTIFPLTLLAQSTPYLLIPLTSLSTLAFIFFFARSIPTANNTFSLRWVFFLFIALEALVALLTTAIILLAQSPLGDGFKDWAKKNGDEKVKGDPRLSNLTLAGISSLHPLFYFGLLGLLVSGLYRLDISLRAGMEEETEEFRKLPAVQSTKEEEEQASEKKKPLVVAGERVLLPPMARSIARHKIQIFQSLPVYFLTGVTVVAGLVALVPVAFSFLFSQESLDEAQLDEYLFELVAVALVPPVLALAITLVSAVRGETSKVWSYRETWGGVRPAPDGIDETALLGEEEKTRNEEVEVDGRV